MPRTTVTDAFLFEQFRPRLQAISRRIVGNEAEAEDIVQDCFLKWQDAEQAALATPAAWLTTVVQHQSIDHLRKRARDTVAARTAMELVPDVSPAPPEDSLLRRVEMSEALARLLACLSPPERLALVLHEVFEFGHANIAATLGTSTVNARQYLARARRRLHENSAEARGSEKLSGELIGRFQAALNGMDVPAIVTLLGEQQSVPVRETARPRFQIRACANDVSYDRALAA